MFFSTTFRWTFVTWRFFSIMAVASILMTLLCLILGVVCRLNFGKGLSRYRRLVSSFNLVEADMLFSKRRTGSLG